jgi:hypothetical protein
VADAQPQADGRDLICYEGKDILVRADLQPAGEVLFVTFSSRREHESKGGPRRDGFGERFLASRNIPFICFVNKANHWWQTAEVPEAIGQLRREHSFERFSRVVTYGASMGAYGALLFSRELAATDVLAFSPQYSVAGELPLQPEWRSEMQRVPILFEPMSKAMSSTARIVLISDPLTPIDRRHINAIQAVRPCERIPVPFSGHSSSLFLHELGLLKTIVVQAHSGELDGRKLRQEIRSARRTTPRYWSMLSSRLMRRGNPLAALRAEKMGVEICLSDSRWTGNFRYLVVKRHIANLLAGGSKLQALDIATHYLEAADDDYRAHIVMSRLRRSLGGIKLSVQQAKLAVAKAPRAASPELNMSMALLAATKIDAAEKHLTRALGLKGGDHREWLETAGQFYKANRLESALAAIRQAQKLRNRDAKILELLSMYEAEERRRPIPES